MSIETEATHERCECCEKARSKIVRHIAHSLGIEADQAATAAVAARLEDAGFLVKDVGTKAERDYGAREHELVQRLILERQKRSHDHVKTLLGKIAADMPDGGVRVFIDDVGLPDNTVCIQIKDGELIDDRTGGLWPQESEIPF
ncbi:MAG: hypothetical protein IID41_06915 [Planctomycetes bacterium]|nr:hypothetical protein [Planctomycetota bacterium]